MRPRADAVTTALDRLREAYFTALALMWIAAAMPASARRRRAGYEQGMATSALLAIYAFRRVQRDCARYLPGMEEARGVLKGLCARYKLRWGDDALVPTRKQPFSTAHTRAILHALDTATTALGWTACLAQAMQVAFCFGMSTGMRKDEWTAALSMTIPTSGEGISPGWTQTGSHCRALRRSSPRDGTDTCCEEGRHRRNAIDSAPNGEHGTCGSGSMTVTR